MGVLGGARWGNTGKWWGNQGPNTGWVEGKLITPRRMAGEVQRVAGQATSTADRIWSAMSTAMRRADMGQDHTPWRRTSTASKPTKAIPAVTLATPEEAMLAATSK